MRPSPSEVVTYPLGELSARTGHGRTLVPLGLAVETWPSAGWQPRLREHRREHGGGPIREEQVQADVDVAVIGAGAAGALVCVHLARAAPGLRAALARALYALLRRGQVRVDAGRLERATPGEHGVAVRWRPRGDSRGRQEVTVARVLDCATAASMMPPDSPCSPGTGCSPRDLSRPPFARDAAGTELGDVGREGPCPESRPGVGLPSARGAVRSQACSAPRPPSTRATVSSPPSATRPSSGSVASPS